MIAATGLIIFLKLDLNHRLISPCDLEIWWMTSKNNKAPLIYYIKLCASFQIHWWIQTGVTVWKCSIQVEIGDFLSRMTLKFDGSPWKTIGHLYYTTSSFVQHFKTIGKFKLELQSETLNSGRNWRFFVLRDLENWWMTLKNNRAPLLCCFKLSASFQIHRWSQTWVTVRKRSSRVKIDDFLSCMTLKFDGWPWKKIGLLFYTTSNFVQHFETIGIFKLKLPSGNAQFWSKFKLFESFHSHWWIQTGVTVWKSPIWVKIDFF